ncbi:MAG TPA: 50S ribosomal protein L10 [Acidobacteriota bacterium]|nr:50S ribosomal protein L10 [Acidobacteriota bacterium]
MERAEKRELVASLNVQFKSTGSVVVAKYAGLSVKDMTALRGKVRAAGGTVKVAKNRLAKLALVGTELEHIGHLFKGPTVILTAKDPVASPKVAADFAKGNDKFVILGGGLGKQTLDVNGVKALAELPSLEELRAKIAGVINQPATKLASVLAAPAGALARVIQARADKDQAA